MLCFLQKKTQKRKYDDDDLDEDMETDAKSKYKGMCSSNHWMYFIHSEIRLKLF